MNKKRLFALALILFPLGTAVHFFLTRPDGPGLFFGKGLHEKKAAWAALSKKITDAANAASARGIETGIVIEDLSTGWAIAINRDRPFPAASLVKVPILASYCYASARGDVGLKEKLVLTRKNKVSGSGVLKGMPESAFTIEELLKLMITESDNTATNMLIDRIGFRYLNAAFKKLGLAHTTVVRKMMDFRLRKNGKENFTTARDTAFLLRKIYKGTLINRECSERCLSYLKGQKLRDRIPRKLPPDTPVAHKTGLERGICHDAGIVFAPQGDFLICVLAKHSYRTSSLAKKFIAQIAREVYNCYQGT